MGWTGAVRMAQVAVPGAEAVLAALLTTQKGTTLPEAPAVKVILLLVVPEVIVPPVMDHA